MKYIILILVAGLIIFVKPWRISLEESIFSPAEDTTLLFFNPFLRFAYAFPCKSSY